MDEHSGRVIDAREAPPTPVTVLGVGNPIMGDDGTGLELLTRVRGRRPDDPRVTYVDGGTGGMALVPVVQGATRLLVLDAVAGAVPGQVARFSGDQLPRMLAAKLSPHQVGLLDVFAAARLLGREPQQVEVVGIVPESVDLHLGLSAPVTAALDDAVAAAVAVLDAWSGEIPPGAPPDETRLGEVRPGEVRPDGARPDKAGGARPGRPDGPGGGQP